MYNVLGNTNSLEATVTQQNPQLSVSMPSQGFTLDSIASNLPKTSKGIITSEQARKIASFIETQLREGLYKGNTLCSIEQTGLEFPIEYDSQTQCIFIHLGSRKEAYIGKGKQKTVTQSILYSPQEPELIARCEGENVSNNEIIATQLLQGKEGIFRVYVITQHRVDETVKTSMFCKLYNMGSLDNCIKKGFVKFLTQQEKMEAALNLLKGLANIHAAGCVHRDLGARNHLVHIVNNPTMNSRKIEVAIADLGRTLPADQASGTAVQGNSKYTAPEGIERKTLLGNAYFLTDVYALGCVLYRLQYNGEKSPFIKKMKKLALTEMDPQVLKKQLSEKLEKVLEEKHMRIQKDSMSEQQAHFEKMILQMIHPNPQHRGTVQELVATLTSIMSKQRG